MTTFNEFFPDKWLKAADLNGKDTCYTMHGLIREKVGKEQEERTVLEWVDDDVKPLILNRTNGKVIRKLYGDKIPDWRGRKVLLYETTVEAFGETHNVIRVKDRVPEQTPVTA